MKRRCACAALEASWYHRWTMTCSASLAQPPFGGGSHAITSREKRHYYLDQSRNFVASYASVANWLKRSTNHVEYMARD